MKNQAKKTQAAKFGIAFSCTLILFSVIGIVVFAPQILHAQGVESIVPASVAIADQLPEDVIRLCLISNIVMAIVLVTTVTVFLRAFAAQANTNTETLNGFSNKPCLLTREQSQAVIIEWVSRAYRDGVQAEKDRNK